MILADGIVLVWVGGAMLIGVVAFFAAIVVGVTRFVRAIFRGIVGGHFKPPARSIFVAGPVACAFPECRHANPPHARFCSRCGRLLVPR